MKTSLTMRLNLLQHFMRMRAQSLVIPSSRSRRAPRRDARVGADRPSPTEFTVSSSAAKHCQTGKGPLLEISSNRVGPRCANFNRSCVTSPIMRIASPGPETAGATPFRQEGPILRQRAHFIARRVPKRLDEQIPCLQNTDIVMRFDFSRFAASTFYHIRISVPCEKSWCPTRSISRSSRHEFVTDFVLAFLREVSPSIIF